MKAPYLPRGLQARTERLGIAWRDPSSVDARDRFAMIGPDYSGRSIKRGGMIRPLRHEYADQWSDGDIRASAWEWEGFLIVEGDSK